MRLKLKDAESAFVFGGDLFDRGPGDLRLARELIDLKKKLGNFDDTVDGRNPAPPGMCKTL